MIESEFQCSEGSEAIGFSHSDFGFVVQSLDDAAGDELLRPEIVEDELAMLAERPGDFLHRLEC